MQLTPSPTNTTTPSPTVSIITPAYNSAVYISRTIDSVLTQIFKNWELLIIDDGSTDTTAEIVQKYTSKDARIRYIKNEKNMGISKSRNRGINEARGKYIAMLDSDDIWTDFNKLLLQVDLLEKNPSIGLVSTWIAEIDENDRVISRLKFDTEDTAIRNGILYNYQITQSSVLFRKEAAQEAGNYDESLTTNEDYDLWLKIGKKYKFAILDKFTLGYRVHQKGITKNRKVRVAVDGFKVILRHCRDYPNALIGIGKGVARIIVRIATPF